MKKREWISKAIGIGFAMSAFLMAQTDQNSWVLKIICRKYLRGMEGVRMLQAGKSLDANDKGFRDICNLIKRPVVLTYAYLSEGLYIPNIMKLESAGRISISPFEELTYANVRAVPLIGEPWLATNTKRLIEQFGEIRKRRIFLWSLGLFMGAIILTQITTLIIHCPFTKNRKDKNMGST